MNRGLQDIFEMLIDVSEITKYIPREKKVLLDIWPHIQQIISVGIKDKFEELERLKVMRCAMLMQDEISQTTMLGYTILAGQ